MKQSYEREVAKLEKEKDSWTGSKSKTMQQKITDIAKDIRSFEVQLKKARNQ